MYKIYECKHYGKTYYNQDEFHAIDIIIDMSILEKIVNFCRQKGLKNIFTAHVFTESIRKQYPDINFFYKENYLTGNGWKNLKKVKTHPPVQIQNFLCSFNGSHEVSRQLFTSILQKMKLVNLKYFSKNFTTYIDQIDGNISVLSNNPKLHRTLILLNHDETDFYEREYSFNYTQDHVNNTLQLQPLIAKSFLNLVCESYSIGPLVSVTEKCLHSIVCRGLFLCYAQQNWHRVFEECYGFRSYNNIFNYNFDTVENPVERLVELVSMIQKFSNLSLNEWNTLYELEKDAIEYNYDHFFSNRYKKHITQYEKSFNTKKL
jgi:hypothetical protein